MSGDSDAAVKSGEANQSLKTLGKYVIERKLGQGGMGTVYLAKHSDLKKSIALKVLPQDKAKNPTLVKRFKSEAQAAAQLDHPNIVAVYDTGEADGYLYIAMELVDGIDLFEHVKRRGAIPVKRSIEIIKQVASALQHAFEQNIVHRDIKPSNLLLRRDGTVKLTDLGLARSIDDTLETNITRAGTTVGTVDYMAPEQARNSKLADIRSDIYSLGCTWYQMLTGEPPFSEGSLTNKLQAHATKPLPDPRDINENIPEGVFAVLQRMTAKKPEDRYQSPAELLEDLAQAKLTNAQFANEIFSDLSDDGISSYQKIGAADDEDDNVDDFEPDDAAPRRKPLSQDSKDSASNVSRRKSSSQDLDSEPDSRNKKPRPKSDETHLIDETKSVRPTKRPVSRVPEYEEEEQEPQTSSRSSRRSTPDSDGDRENDSSITKRRRVIPADDDDDKSTWSKRSKSSSEAAEKKSKGPQKSLPPKRMAIQAPEIQAPRFNAEILKYLAAIGGVLAVILGLGLLISRWSSQVEVVGHPVTNQTPVIDPAMINNQVIKPKETRDSTNTPSTDTQKPQQNTANQKPAPEFDLGKLPYPAWAASEFPDLRDVPVLTVGSGAQSPTNFATLDEAIAAIEQSGAIIRLVGNGPYLMSNVALKPWSKVEISAASPQDQPLIFFKPNDAGTVTGLTLDNGVLDLRGLHFVFDRSQESPTSSNKLITVTDGQLFVRNCSFTASGNEAIATTALSCNFKQEALTTNAVEPQLLLDRVIIRGNGFAGLSIDRPTLDAVIQDSLFLTGTAPAIQVNAHQLTPNMVEVTQPKPHRMIRLLRTTVCVRKVALDMAAESNTKPPVTAMLLQDSVLTTEGSGTGAVAISATRWPSATSTSGSMLTNLSLTCPSTLYLGFERLLDLDKISFKVNNVDSWQRVWGKKFEPRQFQSLQWQENTLANLSTVAPEDFETSTLPYQELKTGSGAPPGCIVSRLSVPGMTSQERLIALSQRQKLPVIVLKPIEPTSIKKVDLSREDLGAVINRNDWQSGTVIEATGAGIKQMSPARISGKSLRIVMRQGDGVPLKLQPKAPDAKSGVDHTALFEVENGLLDLQSATIDASLTQKGSVYPWLLSGKNGSLILRGCQLIGATQSEADLHQGLIHWTTSTAAQPFEGIEFPFLSINDSFLMGNGGGVRANCALGNVFLRNSVLAMRGYGLTVAPDFANFRAAPSVDLEHVTFSATKAAVRFEAAAGVETAPAPVRFFVNYSAICPPLEFKAGEGADMAIVECVGPVRAQKQLQWWGASNGISKEVKTLLKQSDGDPITTPSEWSGAWGSNSEFRFLTGNKGVVLSSALPNKWNNIKVTSYTLSPSCPAATWAEGSQPIGADIRGVENAIVAKKGSIETKPGTSNSPNPSNSTPSVNKKNFGF